MPVPGPVDLAGSLDVFRRSGDDLLDRWDGRVWLRALAVDGRMVGTAARPAGTVADPALLVAAGLQVDLADKQRLLTIGSASERLAAEAVLLRRELALLEHFRVAGPAPTATPFSVN